MKILQSKKSTRIIPVVDITKLSSIKQREKLVVKLQRERNKTQAENIEEDKKIDQKDSQDKINGENSVISGIPPFKVKKGDNNLSSIIESSGFGGSHRPMFINKSSLGLKKDSRSKDNSFLDFSNNEYDEYFIDEKEISSKHQLILPSVETYGKKTLQNFFSPKNFENNVSKVEGTFSKTNKPTLAKITNGYRYLHNLGADISPNYRFRMNVQDKNIRQAKSKNRANTSFQDYLN